MHEIRRQPIKQDRTWSLEIAPPRRRLGVVAGLGPRTTARFYATLCENYRALTGGAYPDVLIHSVPVQRDLVEAFSAGSYPPGHQEALRHLVTRTCHSLAGNGADVIAIVCNTVALGTESGAPARIGMVEAICQRLQRLDLRRVGLLAPATMLSSGAYGRGLGEAGVTVVAPGPRDQQIVDRFIDALRWSPTPIPVPGGFVRVISELSENVDALVLGCADLCEVVDTEMIGKPVIDSVNALVDESCRALLGSSPDPTATPTATPAATPLDTQMTLPAPALGIGSMRRRGTGGADPDPETLIMPSLPHAESPSA